MPDAQTLRGLYLDNPGSILCTQQRDGVVIQWQGGEIASIIDDLVPVVAWMQNEGKLPWRLEWIAHDSLTERWYVRRKDKPQQESEPHAP